MHSIIHLIMWLGECFYDDFVSMQLVIQWSTRSSMRDAGEISPGRGRDGEDRGGKFLRVLGRWGKGVVQDSVTGKDRT